MKCSNGQREGEFSLNTVRLAAHEKLVAFSCKRRVPGRSGHLARAGTPLGAVVSDPAAPPLRRPSATARAGATEYPSERHGVGRVTAQSARLTRSAIRGVAPYVLE